MIAAREAWRAGLFARAQWVPNIIAGVIVGVVALPLALAFAIASGVKPEAGITTSIIAGLVVSVLGGSRTQIAGPTGAFIVVLAGVVAEFGVPGLLIATGMAGVMLVVLGLARAGGLIRMIPHAVVGGFTAGIGIVIWVGEWRDFFGLPDVPAGSFAVHTGRLLAALPHLDGNTTALGLVSLVLITIGPRLPGCRRVPGPVIALVTGTVISALWSLPVATIGSAFGAIPPGLPHFAWPAYSGSLLALVPAALTIAALGAIESLLSATVADRLTGTQHNPNQELVAQGIANILSPLWGGIAATGAIARTATNIRNGGTGPAGMVHAGVLVLVLLIGAPLAGHIPLVVLAAILFVVAWNMSDVPGVTRALRAGPVAERIVLVGTLLTTVFVNLVAGVLFGIALAFLTRRR